MTHYNLTIPVTYEDKDGTKKNSYRRVGTVFENQCRDNGETVLNIQLDFPVGATELVAFLPKAKEGADDQVAE